MSAICFQTTLDGGWAAGLAVLGLLHYLSHIYIYFKFSIKKNQRGLQLALLRGGEPSLTPGTSEVGSPGEVAC